MGGLGESRNLQGADSKGGGNHSTGKSIWRIMKLVFLVVATVYAMSLFLVGASLRSLGMPYLAIFVVGVLASGVGLGWMLLHERH